MRSRSTTAYVAIGATSALSCPRSLNVSATPSTSARATAATFDERLNIAKGMCALAMWMRVCRLFWPTLIRQRIKDERLPAFRSTGSCVPSPASGGGSPLSSQHRRCAARRNVPLRPSGFVEERLHCFEQHQAVLFHHDGVGALGQLDVALARRVDEEREQGLSHVGGSVAVPFRVHEQRRRRDLGGVVVGPPGGEEFIAVLLDAVGRADDRRIHLGP